MITAKPFLKWAGGKTQLLEVFENYFPTELKKGLIENYYEPFLGGGAVFFYIASKYKIKNAFLFDNNKELINIYKMVQKYCEELIGELTFLENKYFSLREDAREKFYYNIRDQLNKILLSDGKLKNKKTLLNKASMFMFLNRTCFNGLNRLNSKGEFNVPFGRYKHPQIVNKSNLKNASRILENVCIEEKDFSKVLKIIRPNSFVYLDPPYLPISETSSFTSYTKEDFNIKEQIILARLYIQLLKDDSIRLMLSNSDPQNEDKNNMFFQELYGSNVKVKIEKIKARRMINCMAGKRGEINELVITNYS